MTGQAQYLSSVEHIMNANAPVVLAGESIPNARAIIEANNGVPVAVVDPDNTLKGVLTSEALVIDGYANAGQAASSPRMTVAPHESAYSVVSRMLARRVDWVPVLRQGKFVGTLTRDCIKSAFGETRPA